VLGAARGDARAYIAPFKFADRSVRATRSCREFLLRPMLGVSGQQVPRLRRFARKRAILLRSG